MQISPRYDSDPIVSLDGPPDAVAAPFLRQRRRLSKTLASLSAEQWAAPSRCEGWRAQDVVAHLTGTDKFWSFAIGAGVAGEPTRVLAAFDPKATPAAMVDAVRDVSPTDTLAEFADACDALCATVESLDGAAWTATGESPVGHVAISALVHHALWDAWVHERDVLLPLGLSQDVEDDEVVASLRYASALAPAFALQSGTARSGALVLDVEAPATRVVVRVADDVCVSDGDAPADALVLTGDAVDVLEALSIRAPWRQPIPADHAWLVAGLADVFETSATP
jgi:uncharacterized protein (TIGR03083 family)